MFIENFSTFDKNDTSNQQLDELSIENDDDKDQEILDNVQEVVSGEFENDTEVHNDSEVHNDTEEQNEDQYEDANQNSNELKGYSDSDHAGDLSDRKSTSGFIFILSGCAISWRSNKQKTVAISSTEAEYIGLSDAAQEAIWLKKLINELGTNIEQVTICGDNLSSMQIVKNSHCHNRSKHIDVRYHFIKDHYTNGNISLQYIESEKLCADFLTKGVNKLKHYGCMKQINLTN